MTIRQLATFIIEIISKADVTPSSSLSPGSGGTLPRSFSYSQSSEPSPTSMSSQSSTGSSSLSNGNGGAATVPLSTGYDPKIRAKLDGVYILDCTKVASGFGDLEAVQAMDFYMDSMKTVPVWYTITSERVWKSSRDVIKSNAVVQVY
jgi:hypothetical protein